MEIQSKWQMTEYERGLIMRVADGVPVCFQLIFNLKNHYPQCNRILEYLIRNKLTGMKLFNWVKIDMGNSPLAAWKYCLSKIEYEKNRMVILGRDFIA